VGLADHNKGAGLPHQGQPPYEYDKWHKYINNVIYHRLRYDFFRDHKEDILQEIHIRLYKQHLKNPPLNKTIVGVIAVSTLTDYLRINGPRTRRGTLNINYTYHSLTDAQRVYDENLDHKTNTEGSIAGWILSHQEVHTDKYFDHLVRAGNSQRQQQVSLLTSAGFKNQQIADILGISPSRVTHIQNRLRRHVAPKPERDSSAEANG
jgi:DNA-directed RNA polymerase specialized sigma24 family protein